METPSNRTTGRASSPCSVSIRKARHLGFWTSGLKSATHFRCVGSVRFAAMILTCPECASRYFVDDSKVGATGRVVRCASCGNRWTARNEDSDDLFDEPPVPTLASQIDDLDQPPETVAGSGG